MNVLHVSSVVARKGQNSPQMTAEEIPNLYKLQRPSPYYRFLYGKVQEVMQEDVRTKRSGRL